MPSYYRKEVGFSHFPVPDRLVELHAQLQGFAFSLWILLHSKIQHNTHSPSILLSDDQIAKDSFWGDRSINPKEISRARAVLKKYGLLHYRKDGQAWLYYATHPITGRTIDPVEAARQAKELNTPKDAELAKVRAEANEAKAEADAAKAELAELRAQLMAKTQTISPSVVKQPRKQGFDAYEFEDTGQVEEEHITQ
jgi:ribosomal protein L29